MRFNYI